MRQRIIGIGICALLIATLFTVVAVVDVEAQSPVERVEDWVARYGDTGFEYASDIAVGANGNVYVTGNVHSYYHSDYHTLAYDSSGKQLWKAIYHDPTSTGENFARAIVVGPSGNVYVTGTVCHVGTGWDYVTLAYDGATGEQIWATGYGGSDDRNDAVYDLIVDSAGSVYVVGVSHSGGTGWDYTTIAYDGATGNQLWEARYDRPDWESADHAQAVALGPLGNIYVTGTTFGPGTGNHSALHDGTFDYTTVCYDAETGNQLWEATYNDPDNSDEFARDIAIDSEGNVYVTGGSRGTWQSGPLTIAYDNSGNQLWEARNDDPEHGGSAQAVAVDASGHVYTTGSSSLSGTGQDYSTLCYDAETGDPIWTARYNGPGNGEDYAQSMVVDATGNVYVTGHSVSKGTERNYATVKYSSFAPVAIAHIVPADSSGVKLVNAEFLATKETVSCTIFEDGEPILTLNDGEEGEFIFFADRVYAAHYVFDKEYGGNGQAQANLRFRAVGGSNQILHKETFTSSPDHQERTVNINEELNALGYSSNARIYVFDGSESYDPDGGDLVSWTWDIYDSVGTLIDTIYGETTIYTFPAKGDYTIRLTVVDKDTETCFVDTAVLV
ncbi:MAG: SBBP repeat-containing protein [Thermoplasmata archaeon]|nr:SBBP repeat-containing protein [Thermoplasmata archaeon]